MIETRTHRSPTTPPPSLWTTRLGRPGTRHEERSTRRNARFNVVTAGFRSHPLLWMHCAWTRFDRSRSLGLAAEMAFWLFLSLLPLAAVVGLITARLAAGHSATITPLIQSLPGATRELLGTELGRVAAWNGGRVGLSAGLVFVWLASSGVHSIFDGIELETELGSPRPWWKKRLLALASCVALSLGASLLTLLGAGLGWLSRIAGGGLGMAALELESSAAGSLVRLLLGFAVALGLVSGLYWVARPPGTAAIVPILPGAILAVVLQVALGLGYALYIKQAGDGSAYLAGLASIGVTLIALYLVCVALLGGVQINLMLSEQRHATATATSLTKLRFPRSRRARSLGGACAGRARPRRRHAVSLRRPG